MTSLFSAVLIAAVPFAPSWVLDNGRTVNITSPRMGWVDTKYQPPCVILPDTTVTEVEAIRFNTQRIAENENGCRIIIDAE